MGTCNCNDCSLYEKSCFEYDPPISCSNFQLKEKKMESPVVLKPEECENFQPTSKQCLICDCLPPGIKGETLTPIKGKKMESGYIATDFNKGFISYEGYEELLQILIDAYNQAAIGKGKERHASPNIPFTSQQICEGARKFGVGYPLGQANKKIEESIRLVEIKGVEAAVHELLGAINYLAAAIIVLREKKQTTSTSEEEGG